MADAPSLTTLDLAVDGPVARLTLDRPAKLNALSPMLLGELAVAARWLDGEPGVKVVVIGGAGRAFSAGFDLVAPAGDEHSGALGRAMSEAVTSMRAVTIAAVHGHCIGGGVVLAAACDLRVAEAGAQFRIPEIELGIPLFWRGIPLLARQIGPALTKELVMTGRVFDADEALRIGFVNRVAPAGDLAAYTDALVAELVGKPAMVLETTKRQVHGEIDDDVATDVALFEAAAGDAEARAAAARYLDARRLH